MRGNENITSLTPLDQEIRFKAMLAAETKVSGSHPEHIPEVESACSWKRIMEPVEPFLKAVTEQLMGQARDFDPEIVPYAQHALNNGGKQLRPTLVALAAGCFGEAQAAHVKAAVIIEMVHLATLVHDDIMDEAEIRRGSPTVAAKWGNEIAVLFGDCLFANALTLAASFPTTDVCRAVSLATNTVCSGEILQTQQRRNFIASRRDYFRVIEMKTGELFTLSCDLAAFLSNAPAAQRAALRAFGAVGGDRLPGLRRLCGSVWFGGGCREIPGHGFGQGQTHVAGIIGLGTGVGVQSQVAGAINCAWGTEKSFDNQCLTSQI